MGGGGLQLLGHKRWHVWRRDARERVERDERLQEQQQREEAARRRLAEQEQRVASLLKRSRDEGQGGGEDGLEGRREHVNLFRKEEEEHAEALDRGRDAGGRKSDRQSDTLGRHGRLPWYAQSGRALGEADGGAGQERERKRVRCVERLSGRLIWRQRADSRSWHGGRGRTRCSTCVQRVETARKTTTQSTVQAVGRLGSAGGWEEVTGGGTRRSMWRTRAIATRAAATASAGVA